MTILCATTEHLPGIRPCTHRDQHRVTCHADVLLELANGDPS